MPTVIFDGHIQRHPRTESESSAVSLCRKEGCVPSLEEFSEDTTLHGLSRVVRGRLCSIRRWLWTFAFLGSISLFLMHSFDLVSEYLKYPHVTKVDETTCKDMSFPAVTLCNVNHVRFTKLENCDIQKLGSWLGFEFEGTLNLTEHFDKEYHEGLTKLLSKKEMCPCQVDWANVYERLGHDIKEMVKSCRFQGKDCSAGDFKPVWSM
ncbi:acid-sensing ion channel 1C-like isoform X2 [Anguilla anguilla]|uniref:acid-sensing ion channel 1C-like isoform X2 n=1 Tax=Anguilla anguilla TaxID=7936 RepID=UPI0015AD34C0|nr:acid-sensing ion channel 1C-like isoform X2 [Anguilla anguilla]